MPEFLAELYLSAADPDARRAASERARLAAETLSGEGTPVQYLRSIFVPSDEICFVLFETKSPEIVRRLAARAGLTFDRILETAKEADHDRRQL